ncbi:MAG TPA: SpoIIE family protein phosphatase [Gammaproteobacteria bacterium]|nr:SpoIIE family protein phosphatase [Gammaproteobacteria bacterium]
MTEGGIEAASAAFTLPGQQECGDRHVVVHTPHGAVIAVIDGVGHGGEAAEAAERAVACIRQAPRGEALTDLMKRCHTALIGSRGAVMNLAAFDGREGTLTWLGIGNVEGRLLLRGNQKGYLRQNLLLRPGVVGQRLPSLQTAVTRVQAGDMVIFATDGVAPDFAEQVRIDSPVNEIADDIIHRYCKQTDDALALVVRYLG